MPADPAVIQKIVRDPEFQALGNNPERQAQIMRDYLHQAEPDFGNLAVDQQIRTAAQVLDHYQPGVMSKIADMLPVIGPIKRAVEDPAQVRPLTRGIVEAFGGEAMLQSGLGRGIAEGLR